MNCTTHSQQILVSRFEIVIWFMEFSIKMTLNYKATKRKSQNIFPSVTHFCQFMNFQIIPRLLLD